MNTLQKRTKGLRLERAFILYMYPPPSNMLYSKPREYRYELNGPPRQEDPVLRIIHNTIRAMGKADMWISAAGISVQNLSYGPPPWPLTSKNSEFSIKLYAWSCSGSEFPSILPVSITDRHLSSPLTPNRILVKIGGKWTPLPQWLKEATDHIWDSDMGLAAQRKWWAKNGKHFPLMGLPPEVRLKVYEHVLGIIRPHTQVGHVGNSDTRIVLGSKFKNNPETPKRPDDMSDWRWRRELEDIPSPNLAILGLSKLTRKEALQAGWVGSKKYFIAPEYLQSVLECPNPPTANWLSRMRLTFTMGQWFTFIRVSIFPQMHIDNNLSSGKLLKGVSTLTTLELMFPNPYYTHRPASTPGEDLYYDLRRRFGNVHGVVNPYENKRRSSCYKVVVDWILTFLFPHIKHIPNILLMGAIKTSIANKWHYILNKEYLDRKQDYRTHGYDWEEALDEIFRLPEQALPPMCSCPLPCDQSKIPRGEREGPGRDSYAFDRHDEYVEGVLYDPRKRIAERELVVVHIDVVQVEFVTFWLRRAGVSSDYTKI